MKKGVFWGALAVSLFSIIQWVLGLIYTLSSGGPGPYGPWPWTDDGQPGFHGAPAA
ncbi:hypothetical protein [Peribacillus sp. SCS-37]|uniref:hypothetical protein n=1 Tax=Paraperibacillus esterisolvens TaxID=3115296 RepID=UPI00390629B4